MSTPRPASPDGADALLAGEGWVERDDLRAWEVGGADAVGWLDDLVSIRVGSIPASSGRDALLLTPTGHVRAAFRIVRTADGRLLLVQGDDQPVTVAAALAPYVLSSDVRIEPSQTWIASVPHGGRPPVEAVTPSDGASGWDLIVGSSGGGDVDGGGGGEAAARRLLADLGLREVSIDALEDLRIREGRARFPIDLDERSVPAEAAWDARIDADKGCFLGQESVARIRNLGHPARVVLAVEADRPVIAGASVSDADDVDDAAGSAVGIVTSASADGLRAIVRVTWAARDGHLLTETGARLEVTRPSTP